MGKPCFFLVLFPLRYELSWSLGWGCGAGRGSGRSIRLQWAYLMPRCWHIWCRGAWSSFLLYTGCHATRSSLAFGQNLGRGLGQSRSLYPQIVCAHSIVVVSIGFYGWFNNGVYLQNVFLTKLIGVAVINHRICGCPILRQNHMVRLTMFHLCLRLNLEHGTGTILSPWTLNRTTTAKAARRFKIWTNTSRISIPSVTWLL